MVRRRFGLRVGGVPLCPLSLPSGVHDQLERTQVVSYIWEFNAQDP
jgi:hypothetical protein